MKLKPCPRCNSNVKLIGTGFNAQIKCYKCGYIRGGFSTEESLVRIWNINEVDNIMKGNKYANIFKQEQIGYALNIISNNWKCISEDNKSRLAEIIGGAKDKQEFIALMDNYKG